MTIRNMRSPEALALERIATAARDVQAVSAALQKHFIANPGEPSSTLELARFAVAMQELRNARAEFDHLVTMMPRQ